MKGIFAGMNSKNKRTYPDDILSDTFNHIRSGLPLTQKEFKNHVTISCRGKKWKIPKDENFEANKNKVLRQIDALSHDLNEKMLLHKERATILTEIIKDAFKEKNIDMEYYPTYDSGFVISCKNPEKTLIVTCNRTRKIETTLAIRTSKGTKITTSISKAIIMFNKAMEELNA